MSPMKGHLYNETEILFIGFESRGLRKIWEELALYCIVWVTM